MGSLLVRATTVRFGKRRGVSPPVSILPARRFRPAAKLARLLLVKEYGRISPKLSRPTQIFFAAAIVGADRGRPGIMESTFHHLRSTHGRAPVGFHAPEPAEAPARQPRRPVRLEGVRG